MTLRVTNWQIAPKVGQHWRKAIGVVTYSICVPDVRRKLRVRLPYDDLTLQAKTFSLARSVKPRHKSFLLFQKPFFSCVGATSEDNCFAFSTSLFLRLPAVSFFQKVCRGATSLSLIDASAVRFSGQNAIKRRFVGDRFRKPLAVTSCLDELALGQHQVLRRVVRVLFAVDELPPRAHPKKTLERRTFDSFVLPGHSCPSVRGQERAHVLI